MKLEKEIKRFARKYKIRLAEARELFALYMRKPKGYRKLVQWDSDAKTIKGRKKRYLTGIVYLAPADMSGRNVCTSASIFCVKACLGHEGRPKVFSKINLARIDKTNLWFDHRDVFLASLLHDAFRLLRAAAKRRLKPCLRPNGTSDLPSMAHVVARVFWFLQVYDYTKHERPWQRVLPNYDITFSRSGDNDAECREALEHGINVSVVFEGELPETFWGYEVIDGDDTDLRFLDKKGGKGYIVGLTAKGQSAAKDPEGCFILRPAAAELIQIAC